MPCICYTQATMAQGGLLMLHVCPADPSRGRYVGHAKRNAAYVSCDETAEKQAGTTAEEQDKWVSSCRQQSAGSLKGIQITEVRKGANRFKAAACPDNSRWFAILQLG